MMNEMMADSDDDELDDELAAFEQDIQQEQAMNMDANFNKADANIVTPNQPQKNAKKDDVDDMFANLMAS